MQGKPDPDIAYNQLIRPWKSRLGIFYIEHMSILLNLKLIALTGLAIVSRRRALDAVARELAGAGASPDLVRVALRADELKPLPPPGSDTVVAARC